MMNARQPGQSLTEYGLAIALIALVAIPALTGLGGEIGTNIQKMLSSAPQSKSPASINSGTTANSASLPSAANGAPPSSNANINTLSPTFSAEEVVQVSGANGSSQILANSRQFLKAAAQFQSIDPAYSNLLIQTGYKGLSLAQSMGNGDKDATGTLRGEFDELWSAVYYDPEYKNLSPTDQSYLYELSNQSSQLAADLMGIWYAGGDGSLADYWYPPKSAWDLLAENANQVNENSNQTIECGKNGKCQTTLAPQ
jgi:Flp pilus assembly pilin Flp